MPRLTREDVCQAHYIDLEKVRYVKKRMQADGVVNNLALTFQVLGDPTRIKIIFALSHKELCVCDLAGLLGLSSSAISHQLRVLRNMRLVKYHKEGRIAYYSLDDDHIGRIFKEGLRHVEEFSPG
ncbi:MAG TPA: ArsR/SmtB family transcription factor [Candidatus Hypogeohydataceae bacterium YC38]|jgi:DNA-binding transcriptional ArsR family regulator|nr:metalloregulator ArsR/SmtB family transcription factor [Candidatus Brocadiales bacterium]